MRCRFTIAVACFAVASVLAANPVWAADDALRGVYERRADLRSLFRAADWSAVSSPKTAGMSNLFDWARQYGWQEYPDQLKEYSPTYGSAVAVATKKPGPTLVPGARFNFAALTADAVLVIDDASGEVLLSHNSQKTHPIASLTKLMTAMVALDHGLNFNASSALNQDDTVGGAMLRINRGVPLTVRDLFNAMLVGSANDAAHAIARQCGLNESSFIAAMNDKARLLGLASAKFADPTGLDVGNVATATDAAALLRFALGDYGEIRRSASSASYDIVLSDTERHHLTNTNALLTDNTNGLYVFGGKTGYLIEAGWNLAVRMQDWRQRPVTVVIFGAHNKTLVFNEAAKAARWVWTNYRWPKS
ncbi:MAG: serine hydrolase [Patescibacteria group bacterium]|nr:serine hydrolase [Patescibacteria group bacterium]